MLSTKDPPQNKGHIQTESEGLEKLLYTNGDQKKAGAAILILDKIDFKTKAVKRDKESLTNTLKQNSFKCICRIFFLQCQLMLLSLYDSLSSIKMGF